MSLAWARSALVVVGSEVAKSWPPNKELQLPVRAAAFAAQQRAPLGKALQWTGEQRGPTGFGILES